MRSLRKTSTVVAVVGMLVLAGCSGFMPGSQPSNTADDSVGEPLNVDAIPDNASSVLYVNSSIVYDDSTKSIMNNLLEKMPNDSESPQSYQEALSEMEVNSTISFEKVNDATVYTTADTMNSVQSSGVNNSYFGVIISSEWTAGEFITVLQNGTDTNESFQETTYNDQTLYVSNASETSEKAYLGVRDDGRFILGTEQAVKDALDVSAGDASALTGTVRNQLLENKNSLVAFASKMPESTSTASTGTQALNKAEYISGAYYAEGDSIGVEVLMDFPSPENASIVADQAQGMIATGQSQVQNGTIKEHISKVSIDVEEQMVSVEYESTVEEFNTLVDTVYERFYKPFTSGTSMGSGGSFQATETGVIFDQERTETGNNVTIQVISQTSNVEYIQVLADDETTEYVEFTDRNDDNVNRELSGVGEVGHVSNIEAGSTIRVYAYSTSGERVLIQDFEVFE